MASKNKKKQTTGLQPKGGAYANLDAVVASAGDEENARRHAQQEMTQKDAKQARKAEIQKAKAKAKREKREKKAAKKGGLVNALRETGSELKKVRWPSFETAVKQTGVVLGVVVIFSLLVFAIDRGLYELIKMLLPTN